MYWFLRNRFNPVRNSETLLGQSLFQKYERDKKERKMKNVLNKLGRIALVTAILFAGLSLAPTEAKADKWWTCNVSEVMELGSRIHVRCSNSTSMGSDTIRYIAVADSPADDASRFTALGNAALMSGKEFRVYIKTSSSTNVSGCASSDCRTPTAYGVRD